MNIIKRIYNFIGLLYRWSSNERYIDYLRKKGVTVGNNVIFCEPRSTAIDVSRPCLIEIGNDVNINTHFTIMTHDFANFVFRNYMLDYVNNCGKVIIGNNIYIGTKVTILRGVTIGDNCVIGAGSVVTKDIPANSVAVGVPCKVVSTIEKYYEKRKSVGLEEAKEYIRYFRKHNHRNPKISEMREEWMYFVDATNMEQYPEIPIKQRVGRGYNKWLKEYRAPYKSYEEFMNSIN